MLPGLFPRVGTSGLGLGQLCTPLCQAGALPAQCGVPEEDLLRRMKGRLPAVCNAVRLQRVWSGSVSRHTEQGAASRGGAPMKGSPPGACGIFRSTHDCHSQSRIAADAASPPPHTQPPSQCIRVVSAAGSGGETGSGKQHLVEVQLEREHPLRLSKGKAGGPWEAVGRWCEVFCRLVDRTRPLYLKTGPPMP